MYLETKLGWVVPELFLETRLGCKAGQEVVPELFLETRLGCKAGQEVVTRTVPGDSA